MYDFIKVYIDTGVITLIKLQPMRINMSTKERRTNIAMPKHLCPVCGEHEFPKEDTFLSCPVCGWINDKILEIFPEFDGGEMGFSLNQAKAIYKKDRKKLQRVSRV